MAVENTELELQEQFLELTASGDKLKVQEFLNNQNISDLAELIYENDEYEARSFRSSIHRAVRFI